MLLLALLLFAPSAAAAAWHRPVDAPVAQGFAYSASRPFAAGQRRGLDFAVRAGARVRAPCTGRVTYAGAVPGRGLGVTLHCGRLTATLLGLSSLSTHAGLLAPAGTPVGLASGALPLRLGARVTGHRFAYRDPLPLLGSDPAPPSPSPLAPPRGPSADARRRPPLPAPAVLRRPRASPGASRVPLTAWLGAGLLAAALTAAVSLPRIHRRRAGRALALRRR